jgi:hypothetical protein
MKLIRPTYALLAALTGTASLPAQTPAGSQAATTTASAPAAAASVQPLPAARTRVSPHETVQTVIGGRGGNRVTITYGRPYSKDSKSGEIRKIWGNLVKWDKADRLGADEATLLLTQKPLVFGETVIPAGAYTLYIVPSETGTSKLAFSSNLGKWGVPVDETKDVARVDLKKDTIAQSVDQLTIAVVNDQATGGGSIVIQWETTQFSAAFTVQK